MERKYMSSCYCRMTKYLLNATYTEFIEIISNMTRLGSFEVRSSKTA
jgi:hypothetical protein